MSKSILFYEAQQSGWLPEGHRVWWRGDSQTADGSDVGLDLSGGWYDAGDHVKFGFPLAGSLTTVAWGFVEFRDAYVNSGELDNMLASLRHPYEYLIKCHVADNEFYAQVGDGHADHAVWNRPESIEMYRPSLKIDANAPGSDLAGETAAAFAAGYLAFVNDDPTFADTLLDHARRLFSFAVNYQGIYNDAIGSTDFYGSSGFTDELCWAATWLHRATGEQQYLDYALQYYGNFVAWAFSWDDKTAGSQLMMYINTQDAQYSGHVQAFLNSWRPGGGITYTPGGLAWRDAWGSLRYCANTAAIAVIAAKYGIDAQANLDWARGQIDYMLGTNPLGISYQIKEAALGWSPRRPHHRAASCNPDHSIVCDWDDFYTGEDNDSELIGALVGGPDQNDNYNDARDDYQSNEVATDYNAGFQTTLAGLVQL